MTQFKLLGFSQQGNIRQFLFQRDDSGDRSVCTVNADLALARKFNLAVQDLPLFCTRLLHTEAEAQPVKSLSPFGSADADSLSGKSSSSRVGCRKRVLYGPNVGALAAEARSGAGRLPRPTSTPLREHRNCSADAERYSTHGTALGFHPRIGAILGLPSRPAELL